MFACPVLVSKLTPEDLMVTGVRFGGPSFVFSFRGPLERRWLVDRHYRLEMLRATAAAAAVCLVDNAEVASAFRRYLLRDAEVVAPDAPADRYEAIYEACPRPS